MGFKSNRDYIEVLKKTEDVVLVKQEVDWELEMSSIIRRTSELRGPAVLFENIKDYPGHRVFGAPVANYRRLAIAFGLDPETPLKRISEVYEERTKNLIKPVMVKTGPCKENILVGDDIDLFSFPLPLAHEGDGGRYAGIWAFEVTRGLSSDWVNWGTYRMMAYNRNSLAGLITHTKHAGMHLYGDFMPKKKAMPIAIVVGADPVSELFGSWTLDKGANEVDYAGAINQEPVELVRCETNDLPVPVHAEIIIEGEVLPDTFVPEGPFGEFTGYRSGMGERNVIKVTAITHRNDPIFTISNTGIPLHESNLRGMARSKDYELFFKSLGIPVTGVFMPPEFCDMVIVVSVKAEHAGIAARIKNAFLARRPTCAHKIIVVDDDVDVFDMNQVLHAFATKCHPIRGINVSEEYVLNLIPNLSPEERKSRKGGVVVFDCTWPVDWDKETEVPPKISFSTESPELQDKVIKNWKSYGFK